MKSRSALSVVVLVAIAASWVWAAEVDWSRTVNLEAKAMPLSQVLSLLLKDSDISYSINPPMAGGIPVTAVLKNVTLQMAVAEVSRAAGMDYRVEGSVLRFLSKDALEDEPPADSSVTPGLPPRFPPGAKIEAAVVDLRYARPGDIAPLLHKPGELQVTVTGNKLLLRGTGEAVRQAQDLVAALDDENLLPRPISVKVAVSETRGKTQAAAVLTQLNITMIEGQQAVMDVGSAGSPPPGDPGATRPAIRPAAAAAPPISGFRIDLTPAIDPEGNICLTGTAEFRWGALPAQVPVNELPLNKCLRPGKTEVIGEISRVIGEAASTLQITATATVGEGRVRLPPGPRHPRPRMQPPGPPAPKGGAPGQPGAPPRPPAPKPPAQS